MFKRFNSLLSAGLVIPMLPPMVIAQDVHPKKEVYRDAETWPPTAPGDVELAHFAPFRAVYDRSYEQGSGPSAGDPREDRVIVTAEEVAWDGREAILITIVDSGAAEHDDTNARTAALFVDRKDLTAIFEMGPLPGHGKNYYMARFETNEALIGSIMTESQEFRPQKQEIPGPGFGPTAWVIASMPLKKDLEINLAPCYSPRGNVLTSSTSGRVLGKSTFEDGSRKEYSAWVFEAPRSLDSPRVSHVYVIDRPPYYLGTETVDLDTGERKPFVWLRSIQTFEREEG